MNGHVKMELEQPAADAARTRYVCPACLADLRDGATARVCSGCGAAYARLPHAYADFAGPDARFIDWWAESAELRRHWLEVVAPKDERFESGVATRVVMPLLQRLGYLPGQTSILSAACGLAADVETLNDLGYDTWGIDCGSRILRWADRRHQERLARASLFELPFAPGTFDVVLALNVLEHIGVVGDTTEVAPDYQQQRVAALRSLLMAAKPGGYVLLSGVARRFPFDFFHTPLQGQAPARERDGWRSRWDPSRWVRVHSPFEKFSLSFGDQQGLARATGLAAEVRPLTLRGFFAYSNLGRKRALRPLLPVLDRALGSLPPAVYASWLSFFTLVLVRRAPDHERV